jgi:hypothetical protein
MNPSNIPAGEVAAIDAVFERAPIDPPGELAPSSVGEIRLAPDNGDGGVRPAPAAPVPPLRDYLRELQQEYAEQQEKGKW